ncbi:MAG: SRPBCC family protein [Gammaproteobacteria bacterium]
MQSTDMSQASDLEREVTLTRILDAPRELVFKVWTDPQHLAQWWGPHGFTNPVCDVDLRPGGKILIHMRGPDGITYPMTGTFNEIVAPERLVFLSAALDQDGTPVLESLTTVTFAKHGDRQTKLTVHARARGLKPIAAQYLAGMQAGWTQSLERLDAHLRQA